MNPEPIPTPLDPGSSMALEPLSAGEFTAVYNMREMWRSLGPRIETVVKMAAPGRNDPCVCGSGKKYKKCCAR